MAEVLKKENGRPMRFKDGTRMTYDIFDNDLEFDPTVYDNPVTEQIAELEELGIEVPAKLKEN